MLKVAAARPAQRIGTLFVNPGGPGGPSTQFAPQAARLLGSRVAARFDVVGIDPRGTGGSGEISCRGRVQRAYLPWEYPRTDAETVTTLRRDGQVRRACRREATALTDHASTADNARDMELVRRALGERRISYYGISYGTYLGATYAAMFPGRVRAMTVDGVLDPVAWSTGPAGPVRTPFSTRLGSDVGTQEALTAALARCDQVGPARCPLAPGAQQTWDRVVATAATRPIRFEGERINERDIYSFATSLLYDRRTVSLLVRYVADLDAAIDGRVAPGLGALQRRVREVQRRREEVGPWTWETASGTGRPAANPAPLRTLGLQPQAVMCSDSSNPQQPQAWIRAAAEADRTAPGFGSLWTWLSSICARQGIGSGADSYRGPWQTRTAYPLLVVGNSHDPSTPIHGARRVHELFAGSRLVTYDGWGHGAIGTGTCIRRTMAAYLLDRDLPPEGRICPGGVLFPRPGA
nr:alpha/beta hydrolase [Nocardioides sp. zg-DK7169]